jgi:hypothetical protein
MPMSLSIPKEFIRNIVDKTSIADYVNFHTKLSATGSKGELKGQCPMPNHADKTASLFVNDTKGNYQCFGCCSKGNIVDFIKDLKGTSFKETIVELARFNNEKIPYSRVSKSTGSDVRDYRSVYSEIHEIALTAELNPDFESELFKLKITPDVASKFSLGIIRPSVIAKIIQKLPSSKKDLVLSVAESLELYENDDYLLVVPVTSRYTDSLDSLLLINDYGLNQLPHKPIVNSSRLFFGLQGIDDVKEVTIVESTLSALQIMSEEGLENRVIAPLVHYESLDLKAFNAFQGSDKKLQFERVNVRFSMEKGKIDKKAEKLLMCAKDSSGRWEFQFCKDERYFDEESDPKFNYIDTFNMVLSTKLESKFSPIKTEFELSGKEVLTDKTRTANTIEYLLGGDVKKSSLHNHVRKEIMEYNGFSYDNSYFDAITFISTNQPSNTVLEENSTSANRVKKIINKIVNLSMTDGIEASKELLQDYETEFTNNRDLLITPVLRTLKYELQRADSSIFLSDVLDNLDEEIRLSILK